LGLAKELSTPKNTANGFVKRFVCKARESEKSEAYFSYVEAFFDEAQRSRRTFYEAIMIV